MYARAARRAAILLLGTRRLRQTDHLDSAATGFACPHCGRVFARATGRDRHVNLDLECRARHNYSANGQNPLKQKRSDEDIPDPDVLELEPPTKRVCIEEEVPPVAGPSNIPIGVTPMKRRAYPAHGPFSGKNSGSYNII
ncbi:hypothetical protein RhiJN_27187 [Ceratobasidium sp. AG-Ba]|nr:hypothetical protein RhiJN_27187 [Ceratobasidium sp. AG-Ba]